MPKNVITSSLSVGFESFQALVFLGTRLTRLWCRIIDMEVCVFLQSHKISGIMVLLQNVKVATQHEQQQVLDLHFDESNAAKRVANDAEN